MPSIPVPFIATAFLIVILLILYRRGNRSRWFLIFLAVAAVQTAIVGMRWSLDISALRYIQPISATLVPICAYFAFSELEGRAIKWARHALGPIAVAAAVVFQPFAIDLLLSLIFLFYSCLVFSAKPMSGTYEKARLGSEKMIARMRVGVAIALALSAFSDVVVSVLLSNGQSALAAPVVAMSVSVLLIAIIGSFLGRSGLEIPMDTASGAPADEPCKSNLSRSPNLAPLPTEKALDEADAKDALAVIEGLLEQGLYKDYDLTLARLARRARLPARTISRAVNQSHGLSITDFVNQYRVEETKRLLTETDMPITQIMLEAGFQTKSNFNRVFKELAGQTPSAFRKLEK